jgi:secretion/DNA translocation related TadE-like protein
MNRRRGSCPAATGARGSCAGGAWPGGARVAGDQPGVACAGALRRCGESRLGAVLLGVEPSRRQAGSASVVALAFVVLLVLAGLVAVDVGLLVVARARAQAAADLAALASLTPPGAGAAAASLVAAGNGAELTACACGAGEAVVTVRTRVRMLPGRMLVSVSARARAVLPEFSPTGGQVQSRTSQLWAPGRRPGGGGSGGLPVPADHGPDTKRAGPGWVPLVMWPGRLRVGSGRPSRVAPDAGLAPLRRHLGWGQVPPLQYASSARSTKP